MRLEARDKRALILGSILVVALLAYLLWPRGSDGSSVELVAADQRQGAAPPAPVQPPPMIAPPPPVAPPAAVPEGLSLTGVAGSGAIFSFADGSQRFVGRGRDVAPGVTLQAVRLRDVILASGAVNYRLALGGVAVPIQPPAQTMPAAAGGPSAQLVVPGAARNAMGGPLITEAQQQAMGQQFVAALEPRQAGGRVTGWTISPGRRRAAARTGGAAARRRADRRQRRGGYGPGASGGPRAPDRQWHQGRVRVRARRAADASRA